MEEKNIRDDMKEQSEMTTQLLLSIFDNMDCITQVDEYGRVFVGYQGITFLCMVCNSYIRFVDPCWFSVNLDTDSFYDFAEAVNKTNRSTWTINMFYERSGNNETILVSTARDILLSPVLPNLEGYVRSVFKTLIDARESFYTTFERMKKGRRNPPSLQ